MKTSQEILAFVRSYCGISSFECKSCTPKYNAQRNLEGRAHYTDDATLAFFKARILSAQETAGGLLFVLIESVPGLSKDPRKNKRAIVFDIFGTIVNDRTGEASWHATSDKARTSAEEFLASFDAVAHTLAELDRKAKRMEDEAAEIRKFLA